MNAKTKILCQNRGFAIVLGILAPEEVALTTVGNPLLA